MGVNDYLKSIQSIAIGNNGTRAFEIYRKQQEMAAMNNVQFQQAPQGATGPSIFADTPNTTSTAASRAD